MDEREVEVKRSRRHGMGDMKKQKERRSVVLTLSLFRSDSDKPLQRELQDEGHEESEER